MKVMVHMNVTLEKEKMSPFHLSIEFEKKKILNYSGKLEIELLGKV